MGGAFNFYEKTPFPKFTGKKREYLGFRREWTEVVIPRYPNQEEFLVREISLHIPAEMEPDIKICTLWLRFGSFSIKSMELVRN